MEAQQIKAEAIPEPIPTVPQAAPVAQNVPSIPKPKPKSIPPILSPLSTPIPLAKPRVPELLPGKLVFKAKYLGIPFCDYIIENKGKTTLYGQEVYWLEIAVKTNPVLEKLFKNKDRYVSYMDTQKLVVLRHEEYIKQGTVLESAVDFDYNQHKAHYKNFLDHKEKFIPIPDKVYDIVSGGFYLRIVPWELGDTVEMNIYADEIVYNFLGLIRSKTSLNVPPYGKQEAFLLKPYLFENGETVKNLSADSYFSIGSPRAPLRAVLNTFLGSVSVVLVEGLDPIGAKHE